MKKYRYAYEPDNIIMPAFDTGSLFLDIETTGFQRTSTFLTIIGLAWMEEGQIIIEQWFNEIGAKEEPLLLLELERFLKEKSLPSLIHYNGTTFDLPYLKSKYEQYHLPTSLGCCQSSDLYHLAKKYRNFLSLTGLKQKNLEEAFGLFREDTLSGQELIQFYVEGISQNDDRRIQAYLLHNREDMEGMVFLQHLIELDHLMQGNFIITRWEESSDSTFLSIHIKGNYYLYKPVLISHDGIHFNFRTNELTIQVPIRILEARYYYSNYKDYYYLPAEDRAIHKSVAEYVEKEYRSKATKETCYTRKSASFLPFPLPVASRRRKECLKECCQLDLFYQCYGDCYAWILKDLTDTTRQHLYCKWLLEYYTI